MSKTEPRKLSLSLRLSLVELQALLEWAEEMEISFLGSPASAGLRAILITGLEAAKGHDWKARSPQACLEWLAEHHYNVLKSDKNKRAANQELGKESVIEQKAEAVVPPATDEELLPPAATEPVDEEALAEQLYNDAAELEAHLIETMRNLRKER